MSHIRNGNVDLALSNLRKCRVALSILRKCHVACRLGLKRGHVAALILGVYTPLFFQGHQVYLEQTLCRLN